MIGKAISLIRWALPLSYIFAFTPLAADTSQPAEPVRAELIAEQHSIQPGEPFWVGVKLDMDKGWDTYWLNPGDAGFPTEVKWDLPDGFTAGPLQWPYPERFENDSLVAYGYTGSVLLLSEITPPADLKLSEPVSLHADVNWLACNDACVPGSAQLDLALPVSESAPELNAAATTLFSQAREALPQDESGNVEVKTETDEIVMKFKPKPGTFQNIEALQFIPEEGEVIDYAAPQLFSIDQGEVTLNVKRLHPGGELGALKGLLLVSEKGSGIQRAIKVDASSVAPLSSSTPSHGVSGVGVALGLAFLGGLILNVMPCVLPVIALKIFSFVKLAHERRSVMLQHGGLFALGVLTSFWILSGALLILRAYGEGIGWGFQLQEPVFVVILTCILFMLGLSLFGLFELGTSLISLGNKAPAASKSPLLGSFMSGVLATLVATPCTGPLLGPALGFAMTLPPASALGIFTMMGLGMAFPYLLFSAFPKLVRFLPKPGNWMIAFKQIMGFLMMATVIWLIWVFGAQTDNMAVFVLLASLLVLAIAGWIFGKWATPTRRKLTRMVATAIAAALLLFGGGAAIKTAKISQGAASSELVAGEGGWEAYTPERVAELQAAGVPVFVDFTAKWCLICQANKVVLHSAAVEQAFEEKGVVTLIGDWTKKDARITSELERLGRTGVPVYALYPGHYGGMPEVLPQTLNAKVVQEFLGRLPVDKTTVQRD